MQYFVYILKCSDNSLYTGYTTNLEQRVKDHNNNSGSKYVRSRLPAKLVYYETFTNKSDALKREAQIKGWRREKKIRILGLNRDCCTKETTEKRFLKRERSKEFPPHPF